MRHIIVMFRFNDQNIAGKALTSGQSLVFPARSKVCPIGIDEIAVELCLGHIPMFVRIERRNTKRQPVDRASRSQQCREIATIAGANDRNRRGVDLVLPDEKIIGRRHVRKTVRPGHDIALFGMSGMASQVEREADAAQLGDLFGSHHVLFARTAPSMDEENARDQLVGRQQGCLQALALDVKA